MMFPLNIIISTSAKIIEYKQEKQFIIFQLTLVIIVTLLSKRPLGRSPVSILCATVRRDDASRGCFVDTEKTWFLKHSLFWLSGLLHEAAACCELGGATLCL